MITILERSAMSSKQVCEAIFNVHKRRSLAVVTQGGENHVLLDPEHMGKWKKKRRMCTFLRS